MKLLYIDLSIFGQGLVSCELLVEIVVCFCVCDFGFMVMYFDFVVMLFGYLVVEYFVVV